MSFVIALLLAALVGGLLYLTPFINYIVMACRVGIAVHIRASNALKYNLKKNDLGYYEIRLDNHKYRIRPKDLGCEVYLEEMADSLGRTYEATNSGVLIGEKTTVFRFKSPTNPLYF